jgi:hypothetical protein
LKNNTFPILKAATTLLAVSYAAVFAPQFAGAQTTATVDLARKYTYADNQSIIDIGTTYDSTYHGRHDVFTGALAATLTSGGGGQLPTSFDAYCVDLGGPLSSTETGTVGPLNSSFAFGKASVNPGANYGGALSWVYNNYASLLTDYTQSSARQSAALQLSLWEIEYNWTGAGLGGINTNLYGTDETHTDPAALNYNFYYEGTPTQVSPTVVFDDAATAAIRADAHTILTTWNGQTDTATLINTRSDHSQSLVAPKSSSNPVPEPSALALLAAGAGTPLIGMIRRRRQA